jgi:Na+/H+-dicarboxylate symporter
MKTCISYLAAAIFGLAATLLFGESVLFQHAMVYATTIVIKISVLILIPLVLFGFSSGVASLRKDRKGGVLFRTTLLWSILSTVILVIGAGAVFRFFPTVFPNSTSAGSDATALKAFSIQSVFPILVARFSGNPFRWILSSDSFLLPIILVSLVFGFFLKPDVEIVRPAYVTMNSFTETIFRIARMYTTLGPLFVFFAAAHWFTALQTEGTIFVALSFLIMLFGTTAVLLLIIVPLFFAIFSSFKVNPYKILFRMFGPAIAGLVSGNIFFSSPMTTTLSRHNVGSQKRVSATSVPLYTIVGRGGSAMIATLSALGLLFAATGQLPSTKVILFVALTSGMFSYVSSLYLGLEVFFITVITLKFLKVDLYGAEMTMLAMMPLLNGLGVFVDSYIAAFGVAYTSHRMGVRVDNPFQDTL